MQVCTCSVNLAGRQGEQVVGKIVTVPELRLIQHIHGASAVTEVVPVSEVQRDPAEEIERLQMLYGEGHFKQVFPGAFPKLPTTLEEIGTDLKAQADALRAEAERLQANAKKLDSARSGAVVVDKKITPPKTADDIFGDKAA